MDKKYERHMEICKELNKIYMDTKIAYGDSFGKTFKNLGVISVVTRISDKSNWLAALTVPATLLSETVLWPDLKILLKL